MQPDICAVCDVAKLNDQGCVGASNWIIGILSPGNLARDTIEKFDPYEENEVPEYWIVSPGEKSVTVYVLQDGRHQVRGEFYTSGLILVHTLPEFGIE